MHWLLGDLQGCVKALEAFVRQSGFCPQKDTLWCLGDLINKGPHSLETLTLWKDLGGRAVLGNHELYALSCLLGQRSRKADTLDALLESSSGQTALEQLSAAPILAKLEVQGRTLWLVHGGVHPEWDLESMSHQLNALSTSQRLASDDVFFATRIRCCTASGEMSRFFGHPRDCPPPYAPWDSHYRGPDLVVHGHWAMRGHYKGPRSMGLDGGYVYGRSLWAYCVEQDRVLEIKNHAPPT